MDDPETANPLDQYTMLSVIGKGSYAKVFLVRKKENGKLFALKSMKKKYIEKKKQERRVAVEKEILVKIKHPFLVAMSSSFQSDQKLFLVLEYCPGGELFQLLMNRKRLTEDQTCFYAAQILLALEYLHKNNIIYRDLKPENVLICADGYIKLTDFGLSKHNVSGQKDAFSVCGTPEYLAPEVIRKEGHGKAVDWWCLGSIIYELVYGLPPFYNKNRNLLFEKIKNQQPYYSANWSPNLKSILSLLFEKNPEIRMENAGKLKSHPWFSSIDWDKLYNKQAKPFFVPKMENELDTQNFDREFTQCSIQSDCQSLGGGKKLEGFSFERSPQSEVNELEDGVQISMKIEPQIE